ICYFLQEMDSAKYYFSQLISNFPDDPYAQKIVSIIEALEPGSLYLQLGKFSSLDNANNLATNITMLGYTPILKNIKTNNNHFYLLLINCKTSEICKKTREELNKLDIDAIDIP
ncbi:MAG: SPOR domain-containing protein, partial [Planctomycetota bacterium]